MTRKQKYKEIYKRLNVKSKDVFDQIYKDEGINGCFDVLDLLTMFHFMDYLREVGFIEGGQYAISQEILGQNLVGLIEEFEYIPSKKGIKLFVDEFINVPEEAQLFLIKEIFPNFYEKKEFIKNIVAGAKSSKPPEEDE